MQSKLLLLIQTHEHAAALATAIPAIRGQYSDVWVVFSPVVLVDASEVSREYDKTIADITEAEEACARRKDYAGAEQYKQKRDAAVLEKSAKVKTAWKTLAPEAQQKATDRVFSAFVEARPAPSMKISQHPDHFEPDSWVEMVNGLKGIMPPHYTPGGYVVAWPTSLPIMEAQCGPQSTTVPPVTNPDSATVTITTPVAPPVARKQPYTTSPRFRQLMAMHIDELGKIALEKGFVPSGNKRNIVIAILKKESATA